MKKTEVMPTKALEFYTVGMHFTAIAENAGKADAKVFVSDMSKILPYLYLKALVLDQLPDEAGDIPNAVSPEEYHHIMNQVKRCLKSMDIPVFIPEGQDEEGQFVTLSELLADVYQDVKSFILAYSIAGEDEKDLLVWGLRSTFSDYWGKKVLFVQLGLHRLMNENVEEMTGPEKQDRDTSDWFITRRQKDAGE